MRIKELHVETGDLQGTRNFYEKNLGLTADRFSNDHVCYKLPESELWFHKAKGRPFHHIAFNIPSDHIIPALAWLQQRAELIPVHGKNLIADFRNWNAESLYFFDNNRNILELIARRDLNNPATRPFDPGSLLSVSEMGIVTHNVEEECRSLKETMQLDYFSRQPPLKDFAAMGDDQGLFIVVTVKRNWYPTEITSDFFNFRIVFSQNEQEFVYESVKL